MIELDPAGLQLPLAGSGPAGEVAKTGGMPTQQDFGWWLSQEDLRAVQMAVHPAEGETSGPIRIPILPAFDAASEGILYEWQIHAQGSLSQLHRQPALQEVLAVAASMSASSGQRPVRSAGEFGTDIAGAAVATGNTLLAGNAQPTDPFITTNAPKNAISNDKCSAYVAELAAPTIWTERLLRTIEAADRSVTIWLRDYRLEKEQLPATVEEILNTHVDGERIARVVVNGSEVWRRNSFQSRRT